MGVGIVGPGKENFYDQIIWEKHEQEICPVCRGKGQLHVYPASNEDPRIPCQHCYFYGRKIGKKLLYSAHHVKHVYEVGGICEFCNGHGYTFFSEKSPIVKKARGYTGETRRLYEDELPDDMPDIG